MNVWFPLYLVYLPIAIWNLSGGSEIRSHVGYIHVRLIQKKKEAKIFRLLIYLAKDVYSMASCLGGQEISAGQAIWQSFDRRQKKEVFIGSVRQ